MNITEDNKEAITDIPITRNRTRKVKRIENNFIKHFVICFVLVLFAAIFVYKTEIKNLAINTYSCIKENGKKINAMSYIKSLKNNDCNNAIFRVFNKIDLSRIEEFINNVEGITNIRKEFYKKIIKLRYNILEQVYKN